MNTKMTKSQEKVYKYILQFLSENSYPPSVREIGEAIGLKSPSTVHAHLKNLEKLGMIARGKEKTRAITITNSLQNNHNTFNSTNEIINLPVLGKITAGQPIEAIEDKSDNFPIAANLIGKGKHFILKVNGESMINAGIRDDDYLIIKESKSAENGEIVAALIDGEATVKTFYKENGHFRLQPENDAMKAIICDEVEIIGLVKGLFRKDIKK